MIDKQTGISIGLALAIAASIWAGSWWASDITSRVESVENQTVKQWQKLSRIDLIATQQAVMSGKLDTILNVLKRPPR